MGVSKLTYKDISDKIKRLEHQMAIVYQIFSNKKYIGLIKEFKEEGIIIISDTDKSDSIFASLIK